MKYWAQLYCPDVILSIYTPDEFEQKERVERDVTSARTRQDLNNLINQQPADTAPTEASQAPDRTPEELLKDFTEAASKAASINELDRFYKYAARKQATDAENLDMATDVYSVHRN